MNPPFGEWLLIKNVEVDHFLVCFEECVRLGAFLSKAMIYVVPSEAARPKVILQ